MISMRGASTFGSDGAARRGATSLAGAAAVGAAATAATWSLPALAPIAPRVAEAMALPRHTGVPGAVALTFDDGPHPQATPAVLEILDQQQVQATFFMIGEQVARHPGLAAEVAAAGHAIAVHGQRHRTLIRLAPDTVSGDLDRAGAIIGEATGQALHLHRAPYGIYSWPALDIVRRRGWSPVLWSRWGHDWRGRRAPAKIAAEVTEDLGPGDVLLLHDADDYGAPGCWRNMLDALPRVLDTIAARGLQTVPLRGAADLAQPSGR
jgi:peptidoglycan-N-acetylglucosamine deacetylase